MLPQRKQQPTIGNNGLIKDKATPVVGSLSWDIGEPGTWDYMGPTHAWSGFDLAVVPYGKGKAVISTLRLVENLGIDPVADKILYNITSIYNIQI